jgi:hypothetical protein
MCSPPSGDSTHLSINRRCLCEAHSIQDTSALKVNLPINEDPRLLFQYLPLTMQQESNARINRARRTASNYIAAKDDEKHSIRASVE